MLRGLSRCHTHMCNNNNHSKGNEFEKDERDTGGVGEGKLCKCYKYSVLIINFLKIKKVDTCF